MTIRIFRTLAELEPFHIGSTDAVACTCPRHKTPFIAIDERAALLFKTFRELGGVPRRINGATRCEAHQADLERIYKGHSPVASAKTSTHVALVDAAGKIIRPCFAFDVVNDGHYASKVRDRDLLRQAGMKLWGKRPRIGWDGYANGCCHADVAFFAPWHPAHVPGAEW